MERLKICEVQTDQPATCFSETLDFRVVERVESSYIFFLLFGNITSSFFTFLPAPMSLRRFTLFFTVGRREGSVFRVSSSGSSVNG